MMFGKAQDEEFRTEIRATLSALLDKTSRLAEAVEDAGARIDRLSGRMDEERRERERLWMRIERIERQMRADADEARALAEAWIEQRGGAAKGAA